MRRTRLTKVGPGHLKSNDVMKRVLTLAWVPGIALAFCLPNARGQGNEVVVIYNTRIAESRDVAEHYAQVRQVPAEQVLGVDLTDAETVSRAEFRDRLQVPLTQMLVARKLFALGDSAATAPLLEP